MNWLGVFQGPFNPNNNSFLMIYYISGGERSGKSKYAQKLANEISKNPVYLATSRIWDDDFLARIERHQADRGPQWETIEEEFQISNYNFQQRVVVMDCVTLWLTNIFTDAGEKNSIGEIYEMARKEYDQLIQQDFTLIVISNEIGMGLHANDPAGRKFVELQGWMNQYIARLANHAIFMVSGIPLTIK